MGEGYTCFIFCVYRICGFRISVISRVVKGWVFGGFLEVVVGGVEGKVGGREYDLYVR